MSNVSDDWFEEFLRSCEVQSAKNKLKIENPWVLDLIRVLWPYNRFGLRRVDVIDRIRQMRRPKGLLPKKSESAIQSAFNRYSEDSLVFQKSGMLSDEAIFFSPKGKGSGIWAVHRDRAEAWLRKKELPDP